MFNIEYQEGFSSWQINNSTYKKIKGGISHNIQLDAFNSIDYKIESGVFFDKGKRMHFTDYQHFGASDMLLNLNSLFDSFLLLDNYELQTNKYWVNLFLNYSAAPYTIPEEYSDCWMVQAVSQEGFEIGKGKIRCSDVLNKLEHWRNEESDR